MPLVDGDSGSVDVRAEPRGEGGRETREDARVEEAQGDRGSLRIVVVMREGISLVERGEKRRKGKRFLKTNVCV